MSAKGIKFMAKVLFDMQTARQTLLQSAKNDSQDIRLAQLLDVAKDAIKDQFAEIAGEGIPKRKTHARTKSR